jgi:hypothetical protein
MLSTKKRIIVHFPLSRKFRGEGGLPPALRSARDGTDQDQPSPLRPDWSPRNAAWAAASLAIGTR